MNVRREEEEETSIFKSTTVRYLECHTAHPTTVCENYCCHLPSALFLLCSGISVPIYLFPCTYTRAHQRIVMYTNTHTLVARRWYYCERACSKQFPIRLPRSIHSVPSSLHSPLPSTPEPLPPMSILSPRSKPLNASAGVHVHPNRLYLHLIASSKVLLPHV